MCFVSNELSLPGPTRPVISQCMTDLRVSRVFPTLLWLKSYQIRQVTISVSRFRDSLFTSAILCGARPRRQHVLRLLVGGINGLQSLVLAPLDLLHVVILCLIEDGLRLHVSSRVLLGGRLALLALLRDVVATWFAADHLLAFLKVLEKL